MHANLMLHQGTNVVERAVLEHVPTPTATRTWQPIPHIALLEHVENSLPHFGFKVASQAHGVTHDGARYFGLLEVQNGCNHSEAVWVLGVRNSHDQVFPAGVCAGSQVLVCDNLCFVGAVNVSRKHTRFILRDLPTLIDQAIEKLVGCWHEQGDRIEAYKNRRVSERVAHHLTIQCLDAGALSARSIPAFLNEWREPRHEEFKPRNLWSYFNAGTETLKGSSLPTLSRRSEILNQVCDRFANLPAAALAA